MSTELPMDRISNALDAHPSNAAAQRMQCAINDALAGEQPAPSEPKPIMTLPEVAAYLRVDTEVISDAMGQLPCFELGGRVLFRREAVDEWVLKRERQFSYELMEFGTRADLMAPWSPRAAEESTTIDIKGVQS